MFATRRQHFDSLEALGVISLLLLFTGDEPHVRSDHEPPLFWPSYQDDYICCSKHFQPRIPGQTELRVQRYRTLFGTLLQGRRCRHA
ncbi:hypothetical protein ASPZODRAFT_896772 [Penicilliopsis zonata CBS 506.65]|uniref:Secreted protein n=1 Tax=Penicilliopsis zonata CBS 506.65 TaxID=1073090 RepID=A0A1L9S8V0_9EURO|nr:hypothetical protein ASPZODRAFT_896772 [Penicilliopsis zonata CBS 506.65]OJJ43586.1 hypothetical protein ASPZODRAFT_896772 [Penicilliopsis zonata CBS 506.65]